MLFFKGKNKNKEKHKKTDKQITIPFYIIETETLQPLDTTKFPNMDAI